MKILLRCAARLYPARWRNRYGAEFDALIDDISASPADLWDVLADVVRVRTNDSICTYRAAVAVSWSTCRVPVVASFSAHGLVILLIMLATWSHVTTMPLPVVVPLPPPIPDAPPQITDARVFPGALTLYSSLPLQLPAQGDALPLYVASGVGINFLSLPDIGATYRQGSSQYRVWPGQALESFIVRRVLPEYPRLATAHGTMSVFVEYLITLDGAVKILRTSGPKPFTDAAKSAVQDWLYRPLECEHRPCEVVSRVEVRFDEKFARSAMTP